MCERLAGVKLNVQTRNFVSTKSPTRGHNKTNQSGAGHPKLTQRLEVQIQATAEGERGTSLVIIFLHATKTTHPPTFPSSSTVWARVIQVYVQDKFTHKT